MTTPNEPRAPSTGAVALARASLGPSWPRVRRLPLIRREIRESLSSHALELLLSCAELIVEGERALRGGSTHAPLGFATVMLTLDLRASAALLREPADEATAIRVAELMRASTALRERLVELAGPRLAELFAVELDGVRVELLPVIRVSGARILIDGDVVVTRRPRSAQVGR